MWIFAGGMQRSASTLQYQIASSIVEHYCVGNRVTWVNTNDHETFLEQHDGDRMMVFKSHTLSKSIRHRLNNGSAKALYIYRDIRDVVSSIKEKFNISRTIDETRELALSLIKSYEDWMSNRGTYSSRYEDVINDISTEIKNIAKHIHVDIDREFTQNIAKGLSIDNQIKLIKNNKNSNRFVSINENITFDSHSLLHTNHITNGRAGRYKENLSTAEIKVVEEVASEWLLKNGYTV